MEPLELNSPDTIQLQFSNQKTKINSMESFGQVYKNPNSNFIIIKSPGKMDQLVEPEPSQQSVFLWIHIDESREDCVHLNTILSSPLARQGKIDIGL